MADTMMTQEQQLCQFLMGLSANHHHRYTEQAARELLSSLFWCMAGGRQDYMDVLFAVGGPSRNGTLKLREAQGAVDGAEFTEAARGHACGHIFRAGEATYSCKTCGADDTCCLCSRCFDGTDHRGHIVRISVSPGNSGCCDCGDPEAWKTPMICTIHSLLDSADGQPGSASAKDKGKAVAKTPPNLEASIRMTIGRALDFMCDVISCSPEQLRQTKTVESIEQDERMSRLSSTYGGGDAQPADEYAVLLWNDEKHTVSDVQHQVGRACHVSLRDALARADETDVIGRSLLKHSSDIKELLGVSSILEEIKVTVTIRSSRDTFREQMCATIIEWLSDISGCSVGDDHHILRRIVCEELLRPWRKGSPATHANVGVDGIDDEALFAHTLDTQSSVHSHELGLLRVRQAAARAAANMGNEDNDFDGEDDDVDDDDDDDDDDDMMGDEMDDGEMDIEGIGNVFDGEDDELPDEEALGAVLLGLLGTPLVIHRNDAMMMDMQAEDDAQQADVQDAAARRNDAAWQDGANANAANEANDAARGTDGEMVIEGGAAWQPNTGQLEDNEATMAGYPAPPPPPHGAPTLPVPPPPPPPARHERGSRSTSAPASGTRGTTSGTAASANAASSARRSNRERDVTPSDSDTAEPLIAPTTYSKSGLDIPKTPGKNQQLDKGDPPGRYWLSVPPAYTEAEGVPPSEDLFQRVRLDWLILFDLRMWKKVRNDLRSLYISTVVTIPEFKRVLGLRFAGLYTTLAQLYLIGDREPDHSIINMSLQMLTTPSITAEIVERGNFLTSLMAILYTFLTTRQVGHPWDVSSNAVLTFDSGSVTNRRMYHFFVDLKYLFSSPHVQECLRTKDRYMMQFLDLVKLHQGICPNTRVVGDHIEYETDSWISASLITREINRLCRQFSDAFRNLQESDVSHLARAIRLAAKTVILSSIGAERLRFSQSEVCDEVAFRELSDFEFDHPGAAYNIVRFVVDEQPISFHHALHYTLSWLIECGKTMPLEHLRAYLSFTTQDLKSPPRSMGRKVMPRRVGYTPEDYLMAAFDYPIRVCAWLAQMKAGMWVRNGISLRHQAGTYRGVSQRDVAHHRDIFLLQTALVVCNPSRVLVSIIDRFGMERWVKGIFEQKAAAQDDAQHLDVVEDMIHLLIVLASDRASLIDNADDEAAQFLSLRRDLAHVLCFKPLSYTDICNRLPDRYQEQEDFQSVLEDMTTYKAPDGMSDVGTFEMDPRYIEEVDPYSGHYNKNQREESETAYRKWMAKKLGQPVSSIVYEPRLQPIKSGVFATLPNFMRTGVFAQLIYYSMLYPLVAPKLTPTVPLSRIETFLQVALHLVLIAVSEDRSQGTETGDEGAPSFIHYALNQKARSNFMPESPEAKTIVSLLDMMSTKEELEACHPKITLILRRMRQKRPIDFDLAYARLGVSVDRISTSSPAHNDNSANEERERKKRAALDRQARVMAQFQEQQKSFLANQGDIDWGIVDDDDADDNDTDMDPASASAHEEQKKLWKYPSGTCILCQENTDDRRLHGSFAFFTESLILRQTDLQDPDFVREAASTPKNLDRSAESIRPFGIAHENRQKVVKIGTNGEPFETERQIIGKGFPSQNCKPGTLSVGCGHIMHHHCFEAYFEATLRRHQQQIARHHPEDTNRLEFVCPLCKALGNAFLPIVWKGKEESYPGALNAQVPFHEFLDHQIANPDKVVTSQRDDVQESQRQYIMSTMVGNVADRSVQLLDDAWEVLPRLSLFSQSQSSAGHDGPLNAAGWPPIPAAMAAAAGAVPGSGGGIGASAGQHEQPNMARDLVQAYRRLRKTLRTNKLPSQHSSEFERATNQLYGSDTLVQAVGYSISAVEIQQRGTDAEYGMTLLTKVPEQALTHLRILCETVTSYIAVGSQRFAGDNRIEREYSSAVKRQHCKLFIAQYLDEDTKETPQQVDVSPLLGEDPFIFLCECVFGILPEHKIEIAHMLRMCYLAELVKVVYYMGRNIPVSEWINGLMNQQQQLNEGAAEGGGDAALANFARFCLSIARMDLYVRTDQSQSSVIDASVLSTDSLGANRGFAQEGLNTLEGYYNFVKKYALVFLRKSVILMYATAGVDFNSHVSPAPELPELERLSEVLRLPSFDEMCASLTDLGPTVGGGSGGGAWPAASVHRLVQGWVRHNYLYAKGPAAADAAIKAEAKAAKSAKWAKRPKRGEEQPPPSDIVPSPSALLSHPGIYELVGLPEQYDQLLEDCTRARCPTTGRDVSEPMLCLMCGEVFCSQATCCLHEEWSGSTLLYRAGGAQQHMRKCQRNMGLFLNVRKCCIFYLHRQSGSFGHAPYIDKYGEVDMGFRHGRPLYLNQKRYDTMLRSVWLSHGIPSFISRKLEMDINNGGWETI